MVATAETISEPRLRGKRRGTSLSSTSSVVDTTDQGSTITDRKIGVSGDLFIDHCSLAIERDARQGMTLDSVTGLYYARNRNYDPSLGRWINQDPAGYINGANTYQFVVSNPVGKDDPKGLSWAWWGDFISAVPQGFEAGYNAVSADRAVAATLGQNQYVNEVDQQAWQQTSAAGTWVQTVSQTATDVSYASALTAAGALGGGFRRRGL